MKKSLVAIISLLIAMLFIKFDVAANSGDSINKINNSNFEVDLNIMDDDSSFSYMDIKQKNLINLEANKEYFFLSSYVNKHDFGELNANWNELPLLPDGMVINIYDDFNNLYQLPLSKKLYSNGILCGYAFMLEEGKTKISFPRQLLEGTIGQTKFRDFYEYYNDLSQLLVLIEAKSLKILPNFYGYSYYYNPSVSSYDISSLYFGEDLSIFTYGKTYEGDFDDPIFNPIDLIYYTNINNPVNIETMISEVELTAYDEIDGDITDKITVIDDGGYYNNVFFVTEIKSRVIGQYPITFSAIDNAGNQGTCTIFINVIDTTPPIINSTSILEHHLSIDDNPITIEEIIDNIDVSDNYSEVDYFVISNNYFNNEKIVGEYQYVIGFIDESANVTEITVTIYNNDYIPPVFGYSDCEYNLSYRENKTIEEIINDLGIIVTDNYYQVEFTIIEDNYSPNISNVGTYTVTLEAIDGSDNRSELVISINIIDDKAPVFFVNDAFIATNVNERITKEDIREMLISDGHTRNESFTIEVISDDYSNNYQYSGDYQMRFKLTYEDGVIEYKTIGVNVSEIIEEMSFFAKAWKEIKKIFLYIWNIIKWPFEKIIALF